MQFPTAKTGTWGGQGDILFSVFESPVAESRVKRKEERQTCWSVAFPAVRPALWPYFLPDGKKFLYNAFSLERGDYQVWIGSIGGGEPRTLMQAPSRVEYVSPGYVLFVREGALLAQRFNSSERRMEGTPVQVVGQMEYFAPSGFAPFSVSQNGVLAYQPRGNSSRLAWMDRNGRETGTVMPLAAYQYPRLSPDGKAAGS